MNNKSIFYWLAVFFVVFLLWPLIKWLILFILIALLILFISLRKRTRFFTNIKWDDNSINQDYDAYHKQQIKDDNIIDVEYKKKDID